MSRPESLNESIGFLKTYPSIKPTALKGELSGLFKLREGDYRIIYQILHKERTLVIHAIGHRREIYR
jgi:mRNA interferase RelE/StbE